MFSFGIFSFFAGKNRRAQARVGVWFAAADARGNRNFPDNSGENAASLGVSGGLLCLIVAHFECPDNDPSSFVHVTTASPRSSIEEFFAPQSGFRTCRPRCRRTLEVTDLWPQENRNQCGEYGEPQTPAEPR